MDGELAGEGEGFQFKGKGLEVRLGNIASDEPGEGSGLSAAEGGAILEFRVYNMALGEDTMAELAGYNEPWPTELKAGKEKPGLAGQNLTAVLGVDLLSVVFHRWKPCRKAPPRQCGRTAKVWTAGLSRKPFPAAAV